MSGYVLGTAEHVHEINLTGDVDESAKDLLPQNFLYLRLVDGNRNHF
jgi:hypothetical protein